jgi:hypothetical protein
LKKVWRNSVRIQISENESKIEKEKLMKKLFVVEMINNLRNAEMNLRSFDYALALEDNNNLVSREVS